MRRFCGCDKGTHSVPATAKMWRSKNAQRAQARLHFYVARAADRRRSAYSPVIRSVPLLYFLQINIPEFLTIFIIPSLSITFLIIPKIS